MPKYIVSEDFPRANDPPLVVVNESVSETQVGGDEKKLEVFQRPPHAVRTNIVSGFVGCWIAFLNYIEETEEEYK
jgi:hypothetical protein